MNANKLYFAPMMANDLGLGFSDKRNRNPNWTDHEIMRFLEILQEDKVQRDLMAQRNKQVFFYVAERMTAEGSEKSWDQCRIKLKNLKSQYRYVKDRIPNIDEIDLEDEDIMKQLIAECQGRGISPSNIKHLRYLRRFLNKTSSNAAGQLRAALEVRSEVMGPAVAPGDVLTLRGARNLCGPSRPVQAENFRHVDDENSSLTIDESDSVSPPVTPACNVKILHDRDDDSPTEQPPPKKKRDGVAPFGDFAELLNGSMADGYRFIEKFNRDMMDQFLEYQRRSSESCLRWEQERYRQEQLAVEQWRQEAREHEKQMFGIFCSAISHCNAALNILLKAKQDASDEAFRADVKGSAAAAAAVPAAEKSPAAGSNDAQETPDNDA